MNSTCELGDDAARALKPYPAYKDSGIEWLGAVPEHWEVRRLGTSVHGCINGIWGDDPNGREDLPCVRVADFDRARLRVRLAKPTLRAVAPGERKRRLLKKSDLLLEKSGGGDLQPVGVVMLYDHDVEAVCSNFVARMPVSARCNSSYLTYLHSHLYAIRLNVRSIKQTTGIQNLDSSLYLGEPVAFPPLSEQAAIVRFLDYADRRIRRYIRAKQQLITLLAETREAATHDALRSAGSRSLRIGSAADRVERLISRRDDQVYTPIGLYNRGRGIFHKPATMGSDLGDSTFFWLAEGDLVLSGQFAWEGAVALAGEEDAGCVASHRYPVLRGKPDLVESAYLLSFFRTGWGQLLLDHHSRGAAGRNRPLNAASLMKERIPVPSLHVQKQIGTLVRREYRLRQALAEQATLLREYRTRLIADVVTGKFDVLEAAARLPDEVEELEPLDEADALIDSEEEPTDALATVP